MCIAKLNKLLCFMNTITKMENRAYWDTFCYFYGSFTVQLTSAEERNRYLMKVNTAHGEWVGIPLSGRWQYCLDRGTSKINHFQFFNTFSSNLNTTNVTVFPSSWTGDLVVKVMDSQSRGPMLKTTGWRQGRLSLWFFRGR